MALDGITLDQLRVFVTVVEEDGFSAAARRLRRAQSAVSHAIANLEEHAGVPLFDRSRRRPALTDAGRQLLIDAAAALERVDEFKARARGMARGLEAELSLTVDVMYPLDELALALTAFREQFPTVPLRLDAGVLGAVAKPVIEGRSRIGILGKPAMLPQLVREPVRHVQLVAVCSRDHPLAALPRPPSASRLEAETQLVLTDRSEVTNGRDYGVFSRRDWRLADLGAKHALLRAGLGWGFMPAHSVAAELGSGALVDLELHTRLPRQGLMPLFAAWRRDDPPGPAGAWLIDRLKESSSRLRHPMPSEC